MLLTFQVKLERIVSREKFMTTRIETPSRKAHWTGHATMHNCREAISADRGHLLVNWDEFCHIWWLNPRNRNKFCRKIGVTRLAEIVRKNGKYLTYEDALADGFDSLDEYIEALRKVNDMSKDQVLNARWYQYVWDKDNVVFEPWVKLHLEWADLPTCTVTNCPIHHIMLIKKEEMKDV